MQWGLFMLLNKNKKGFVLMEAIVVIVVIVVALMTLFASYNKILTKVKKENKYDTYEKIVHIFDCSDNLCQSPDGPGGET